VIDDPIHVHLHDGPGPTVTVLHGGPGAPGSVADLAAVLPDPVVVIGSSWGAMLGLSRPWLRANT
jgi:hypothetical protein